MEHDLTGKFAFVSGSSQGIGLAIALALQECGCTVAINGRNAEQLEKITQENTNLYAFRGDMSNPVYAEKCISQVIAKFGKLDILICNVGGGKSVPPGEETYNDWLQMINLNLFSATNLIEHSIEYLSKANGSIVCISSICGVEVIPGAPVTYSVAKAGINSLVKGLARPFAKKGVRINAIAVGNILFKNSVWARKKESNLADVNDMLDREVPLRRLGDTKDVSNLVLYLISDHAKFATGAIWNLDGGQTRS